MDCCATMVDSCGFKISFTKRAKANWCRRGGGGGGRGGLKLSVLIEAYLQPCISDNLIRTCIGEEDCQNHRSTNNKGLRHECSELTVSIGIDIWKDARRAHLWQQLNEVTVVPTLLPPGITMLVALS